MERKDFSTTINAPRERVWEILWSEETYPKWTAAFAEGSRATSDWKEGSKIYFVNADGEGTVALIEKRKDPEIMNFKHVGMIDKNGNEDLESEKVKSWVGCVENYRLEEDNGKTRVVVSMDLEDSHKDYFFKTWPKAMKSLKELSEENSMNNLIKIKTVVHAPVPKIWDFWTKPEHIENWNAASEDWHTPKASNDLKEGGRFTSRMEAKDGSAGFDFCGTYTSIKKNKHIAYVLDDKRHVQINFSSENGHTLIKEEFEAEKQNSRELQQQGWQAILDNFKKYVENQ